MKVAIYARVSTTEQMKHGLSIEAQLASLREWANARKYEIVGEYVDAGVSGKKPWSKRPELARFVSDLESGLMCECLVFTKLDRFFRSVKLYYQANDVLEKHNVCWKCTQESYSTLNSVERLKLNILLAVSEQEADRTAERIKTVFDRKVELGECLNPNGLPLGYSCVNKKVVPDENAPAARAVFDHYAKHGNKRAARDFLQAAYGISLPHLSVTHMLSNPLYKGEYRGNKAYCTPIVEPELFDQIQYDLENRSTRQTPSGMVYLFSGLIVCRECGRKVCAGTHTYKDKKIPYYRCPHHYMDRLCDNKKCPREHTIESFLVDHIAEQIRGMEYEYKTKPKAKPKVDREAIIGKLDRLKELYVEGLITKEQYKKDYDKFNRQLSQPTERTPDFETLHKIIGDDFRSQYDSFNKEQRKTFWRSVLDRLEMDKDGNFFVYFK